MPNDRDNWLIAPAVLEAQRAEAAKDHQRLEELDRLIQCDGLYLETAKDSKLWRGGSLTFKAGKFIVRKGSNDVWDFDTLRDALDYFLQDSRIPAGA